MVAPATSAELSSIDMGIMPLMIMRSSTVTNSLSNSCTVSDDASTSVKSSPSVATGSSVAVAIGSTASGSVISSAYSANARIGINENSIAIASKNERILAFRPINDCCIGASSDYFIFIRKMHTKFIDNHFLLYRYFDKKSIENTIPSPKAHNPLFIPPVGK